MINLLKYQIAITLDNWQWFLLFAVSAFVLAVLIEKRGRRKEKKNAKADS